MLVVLLFLVASHSWSSRSYVSVNVLWPRPINRRLRLRRRAFCARVVHHRHPDETPRAPQTKRKS